MSDSMLPPKQYSEPPGKRHQREGIGRFRIILFVLVCSLVGVAVQIGILPLVFQQVVIQVARNVPREFCFLAGVFSLLVGGLMLGEFIINMRTREFVSNYRPLPKSGFSVEFWLSSFVFRDRPIPQSECPVGFWLISIVFALESMAFLAVAVVMLKALFVP